MKKRFVIKKYEEFKEILNTRRFRKNDLYSVYFRKNYKEITRVGILITKKHGNAVRRNRIKRQIREILSNILLFNEGYDLIITISKQYNPENFSQNKELLTKLLLLIKGDTNE